MQEMEETWQGRSLVKLGTAMCPKGLCYDPKKPPPLEAGKNVLHGAFKRSMSHDLVEKTIRHASCDLAAVTPPSLTTAAAGCSR